MKRYENSPRSAMASLRMQRTFRPSSAGAAPLRRGKMCANDPRQKAFDMLKAPDEARANPPGALAGETHAETWEARRIRRNSSGYPLTFTGNLLPRLISNAAAHISVARAAATLKHV